MKGSTLWKLILSAAIFLWAGAFLIPLEDQDFETFIAQRPTADESEFATIIERAKELMGTESVANPNLYTALRNLGEREKIDFKKYFPDVNLIDIKGNLKKSNSILLKVLLAESQSRLKRGLDLQGGVSFTLTIDEEAADAQQAESRLEEAVEIMSNRLNGLGVAEPLIRAVPPNSIEIQLPGISLTDNPDAVENIQKPARLEFRLVHRTLDPISSPKTPIGYELLILEDEDAATGAINEEPVFVKRIPEATGKIVEEASAVINQNGGWEISLEMTGEGADKFGKITQKIYDEDRSTGTRGRLAIVLDGKLYSAPGINEPILTGRASITGNFSQREVVELANVLNNPLEFSLKLEEMYEVGPSLAKDARDASLNAALLGAALIVAFMLLYYLSSGIIAVISVILNVIIVLGMLASLGATLTLPGVAALVLTIGMAVDANILIFERIREELKTGNGLKAALKSGYDKVLSTIVDANVTTLITAFILIQLGTGPVKGFGITLAIGIGTSMFGALVISRGLLELLADTGIAKKLVPSNFMTDTLTQTNIDFQKFRWPAFVSSWALVIIGVVSFALKGDKVYGIDFLGGSEVTIDFKQSAEPGIGEMTQVALDQGLGEIQATFITMPGEDAKHLKIQTVSGKGREVFEAMKAAFPDSDMVITGERTIGASVSENIRINAISSVTVALFGILLYVALRFEFGYGLGAVAATVHDVLMTIGLFILLGNQITAPMVAAILMIVGYSINDTIVVFDRIREELELNPEMNLADVVKLAINRTLSRTVLTSITTFLAAGALFFYGQGVIHDFALIFIIGILTGTFSSIFIASPIFFMWHRGDRKHVEEREIERPAYEWEATSSVSRKNKPADADA